ncbi:MAG: IS5 family transposase, partial [Cyanobacteria bacterium J06649_11]
RRTRKQQFFKDINIMIEWHPIGKELDKIYTKGKQKGGQSAYRGILLFKMLLIGIWYDLSDQDTEDMVLDSLSAMDFCGLKLEDDVPDHSTLSRFRSELTAKKSFDRMLRKINGQLKQKGVMIKEGKAKVDATLTDSPRSPKGKKTYEVAKDREEGNRSDKDLQDEERQMQLVKAEQPGSDSEARWLKKRGKLHYGYKQHIAVDGDGMIEAVYTTTANEHDSKGLIPLLKKIPKAKKKEIWADKGYKTAANDQQLEEENIKNRAQDKGYRNKPLNTKQKFRNTLISKQRYKVERTFGSMKKWFGTGTCRYVGIEKTHTQHILEAIAHNLKRSPGLVWEKSVQ